MSNQNLTPHPGGRPLTFESPEILAAKIKEYFDLCDNGFYEVEIEDPITKKTRIERHPKKTPYTMMGLANALGVDRRTIVNYSHRDDYAPIIQMARQRVEQQVEEKLIQGQGVVAGQIFWLKNNAEGYKDELEINDKKQITVTHKILEGYGLDRNVIDADEITSLKKIASGD